MEGGGKGRGKKGGRDDREEVCMIKRGTKSKHSSTLLGLKKVMGARGKGKRCSTVVASLTGHLE